jgi:hypothetical protein
MNQKFVKYEAAFCPLGHIAVDVYMLLSKMSLLVKSMRVDN